MHSALTVVKYAGAYLKVTKRIDLRKCSKCSDSLVIELGLKP